MSDGSEVDFSKFIVAKVKDKYYYLKKDYSDIVVPYLSQIDRRTSTTATTRIHTMEEDGFAICFVEGGTANQAGNGRPTATFTINSGTEPIFSTTGDYTSNSNWYFRYFLNAYYLKAGDTISVFGQCKSGNSYTYCFTGIQTIYKLPNAYNLSIGVKGFWSNTSSTYYTHKGENYKEEFAWFWIGTTGGATSAAKPTVSSTDNSYLIRPDLAELISLPVGSYSGYSSSRFFKLPRDIDFTISGKGNTSTNTRCPATCVVFTSKY